MNRAIERALGWVATLLVDTASARPAAAFGLAVCLTVVSGWLAATRLEVDIDPDRMMSAELPYRQTKAALEESFPQLVDNLVVLVEARRAEDARDAARELAGHLDADRARVGAVFLPAADPFFEEHGIWYADGDQLAWISEEIERAAPLLLALEEEPRLDTLVRATLRGLEGDESWAEALDAGALWLEALGRSLEVSLAGGSRPVPWSDLLLPEPPLEPPNPQTVLVQPAPALLGFEHGGESMAAVREAAARLAPREGLRVRITGDVAVSTEEMSMITVQVIIASVVSLLLVTVVLFVTLRSFRLFVATLATLLMGLAWTAGFAAVAVGHLNVLTAAFAVLYVGLGVDFGIHFALGFREQRGLGHDPLPALHGSGSIIGSSLVFCAMTTAIGFFAFIGTTYTGVEELGIISGTGVFLSLLATLTVYPALIALGLGRSGKLSEAEKRAITISLPSYPLRHPLRVSAVVAVLALASLTAVDELRFDTDPLNVRDPRVESVVAMTDLLSESDTSPWTIEILAADAAEAEALRPALLALPEVDRVLTLEDFVPELDGKAESVRAASRALAGPAVAPPARDLGEALGEIAAAVETGDADDLTPGVDALAFALARYRERRSEGASPDAGRLDTSLFAGLPDALATLRERLGAAPITRAALPARLADRWVAPDGRVRIEVFATENLREPWAQDRFVDAVQTVRPEAGGAAVNTVEFARAIMGSLRTALLLAVLVIAALLLVLWRSVRWALITIAPLLVGALLTAAVSVEIGLTLNFANVIVLPLILGIGVDSGIHLVHRFRLHRVEDTDILHTSTARAVLFSALTSLASFSTLGFASHQGISSLAQLLTIGLTLMLFCNLVLLPALLTWLGKER